MAVVSISRIQVRRGQEQSGSGLPQLASGELGWAVDTQRLYIGNGSVSEGAPSVGNTQIVTKGENLFDLLEDSYTYRDGSNIAGTVTRGLQERLDDRVSVRAFGAVGDGTDQTAALQAAIYQLYLGTPAGDQAVLHVEPGTYLVSGTIYVPNNTRIVGAGKDKTIIRQSGATTTFWSISSELSTALAPVWTTTVSENNQPSNISISGLTIENTLSTNANPMIHLFNCKDSEVKDVKFKSSYDASAFSDVAIDGTPNITTLVGIQLSSMSLAVGSHNNTIEDCEFDNLFAGVFSNNHITNNTIRLNKFTNLIYGVGFGLQVITYNSTNPYPNNNVIENNMFDTIYATGIASPYGVDNVSRNNKFYDVGNRYAGPSSLDFADFPNIQFGYNGNLSVDDWFERQYILTTGTSRDGAEQLSLTSTEFAPLIEGPVTYTEGFANSIEIQDTSNNTPVFRVAADTIKTYEIEYLYESGVRIFKKFGTLTLTIEPTNQEISIIDDYDIIGQDNYSENIEWTTSFTNNDTVLVSAKNPGDSGIFTFSLRVKS